MYLDEFDLIPNVGIKNIKIGMNFENVREILEEENIDFIIEEHKENDTGDAKWFYIVIKDYMTFYFAKNVLWKIDVKGKFNGKLNNGIKLGMNIKDVLKLDKFLKFDDWEDNYISSNSYLLECDYKSNKVVYIAIGIKEAISNDIDAFYKYDWVKRYQRN